MSSTKTAPGGAWRFRCGATLFGLGFAAPALIPIVTSSQLPGAWKTAISGFLAVGVPEIMMVVAAGVMGKAGYAELKRRLGRVLRRFGPPQTVSRSRYRLGLALFSAPLVLGWLGPYFGPHLPTWETHSLGWHVGGDLLFLVSFFVLGGDFWDKVRSLFMADARAVLSPSLAIERAAL